MMRILIGYDGSEGADAAIYDLKRAGLPGEAEALIVSVADVMMSPASSSYEIAEQALTSRRVSSGLLLAQKQSARVVLEAKAFANRASERLRSYFPNWHVSSQEPAGEPSQELVRIADKWKPDLIVVVSHRHSFAWRLILGSVSKKVVTDSHYSVRVTRGKVKRDDLDPIRIVIGVDGSSEAEHAVRAVGSRIWPNGTEVRIVAVDDGTSPAKHSLPFAASMNGNENLESALAAQRMVGWAENELRLIGLKTSVTFEHGDPQKVLLHQSAKWDADVIFVGGRTFSSAFDRFWLGSVATGLVTIADRSVEVVRISDQPGSTT